jgi:hypothetical protein
MPSSGTAARAISGRADLTTRPEVEQISAEIPPPLVHGELQAPIASGPQEGEPVRLKRG